MSKHPSHDFDDRFDADALLAGHPQARRGYDQRMAIVALGDMIRQAREKAGLTQKQLAARVGTSQPHLSDVERGTGPQGPSFALLLKIADACGVTVSSLVAPAPATAQAPRRAPMVAVDGGRGAEAAPDIWNWPPLAALDPRRIKVIATEIGAAAARRTIDGALQAWMRDMVLAPLFENFSHIPPVAVGRQLKVLKNLPTAEIKPVEAVATGLRAAPDAEAALILVPHPGAL